MKTLTHLIVCVSFLLAEQQSRSVAEFCIGEIISSRIIIPDTWLLQQINLLLEFPQVKNGLREPGGDGARL